MVFFAVSDAAPTIPLPAAAPTRPTPAPTPAVAEQQKEKIVYEKQDFSKIDIESMVATASAKALEDYELLRKQRKQKKVVAQKEETDRQKIRDTIHKAQTPSWKTDNPFSNCY